MRVDHGIGSVLALLEAPAREVTDIKILLAPALLHSGQLLIAQHAATST